MQTDKKLKTPIQWSKELLGKDVIISIYDEMPDYNAEKDALDHF